MDELSKILDFMREHSANFKGDYYIPEIWNSCGFKNFTTSPARTGEINVNPYEFFCFTVENGVYLSTDSEKQHAPLIYSTIPRSFTAWNHSGEKPETGSFIKLITLLPLLSKYGVTIIYLLPICRHGEMNMKGELGSPYAIRDFYELDSTLHDPLLGDYSPEKLHSEFCAFVDACHILNIKVVLDFAFRTVSRDNVLIEKHPDWVYWIQKDVEKNFQPPKVKGRKAFSVTRKNIKLIYHNEALKDYLKAFRESPDKLNPEKWEEAVKNNKTSVSDIKETFGVTTVPGFSDVVNDVQPAWTDVTYLKYYLDAPKEIEGYIKKDQAPFILQDGASLNVFHGEKKNVALWNYIINILPFYYNHYGIDGARIDMSHAMPPELNAEIIKAIKSISHDFILYSEEFNVNLSEQAKLDGFNIISGFTYATYKKSQSARFNKELLPNTVLRSRLPVAAAIETPDTPRSMFNFKDADYVRMLYLLNAFLPTSIPMLNSGNELLEVQPMNLGLDNTEEGRYVLPKSDPMYGKLAFFDNFVLHWTDNTSEMRKTVCDVATLRKNNLDILKNRHFVFQGNLLSNRKLTSLLYFNKDLNKGLLIVANRSMKENSIVKIADIIPETIDYNALEKIYGKNGFTEEPLKGKTFKASPSEAIVIKILNKGE